MKPSNPKISGNTKKNMNKKDIKAAGSNQEQVKNGNIMLLKSPRD